MQLVDPATSYVEKFDIMKRRSEALGEMIEMCLKYPKKSYNGVLGKLATKER